MITVKESQVEMDLESNATSSAFNSTILGSSGMLAYYTHYIDVRVSIPLFSLLGIVCILSNAFVCYIIITRTLPNGVIKYYIFSLAITDSLLGTICIPLTLWTNSILSYKQLSQCKQLMTLYSVLLEMKVFLNASSILHLCLIAFDRMMAVSNPFYHRRKLQKKSSALKLLTIPWLLALLSTVLSEKLSDIPIQPVILTSVLIILPGCFITTCYSILFHKIRKRNSSFSNVQSMQQINERRIVKIFLAVTVAFFICWMPVTVNIMYCTFNSCRHTPVIGIIFLLSDFMEYFNSACNPFIYAALDPAFRTVSRNAFRSCRGKARSSTARIVSNTTAQGNSPLMKEGFDLRIHKIQSNSHK